MSAPEFGRTRILVAELLGTALLVLGGVGTAVLAGDTVGDLGVALAFGLTLLALVHTLGPISGAHLNPAVTLGMLAALRIRPRDAAGYIVAQLLGGGLGALAGLASGQTSAAPLLGSGSGLGANAYGPGASAYTLPTVLGAEVLLTFVLVLVVLAVTDQRANTTSAGVPIGLTLALIHLVAIPIDATSVNPARSLGPALLTGGAPLAQLWVFLLAPLVGGLLGALGYRYLYTTRHRTVTT